MKPQILLVLALGLSACTSSDPDAVAQHDPFEPANRAVFNFDVQLDHTVATPIAKAYRTFIGKPVFVNHVNENKTYTADFRHKTTVEGDDALVNKVI